MQVKQRLLAALEQQKGAFVSGAALAKTLFVSRNAVWKAVQALREEGYPISAIPNKGYCLSPSSNKLTKESILPYLSGESFPLALTVLEETVSTNQTAKQLAENGAPEGTVVAADRQTGGKGRLGRSFHSPGGTGLYFSLVLRPKMPAAQAYFLTVLASVATAQAIEEVSGEQAAIKWVNDIYVRGKKVCGILTEAAIQFESGALSYAVLGIGINVNPPQGGFPADIAKIAGAVCPDGGAPIDRSALFAAVLKKFWLLYAALPDRAFLDEYRSRSFLTGKTVTFQKDGNEQTGVVLGIGDDANLLIKTPKGGTVSLLAGEVSVKPLRKDEQT